MKDWAFFRRVICWLEKKARVIGLPPAHKENKVQSEAMKVPAFTLYTLHPTPYTKQGSERSDEGSCL